MKSFKMKRRSTIPGNVRYMREALLLASRGLGQTHPNPMVGAVLVKNGRVIGRGTYIYRRKWHAEIMALHEASASVKKLKGSTMYVTLEPCSTWGRTPPCVDAIVNTGIRRVVIGCLDPNPKHRGRGVKILKKMGIQVTTGVLEEECKKLNEDYFTVMKHHRPFVILKSAMSLDGKIATVSGASRYISSQTSRRWVRKLRREVDGVLVGAKTVLADNPRLTCPGPVSKNPVRIILDGGCRLLTSRKRLRVLTDSLAPTLVFTARANLGAKVIRQFARKNVRVIKCPRAKDGTVAIAHVLRELVRIGIYKILVEGGGETMAHFWNSRFVDKCYFFIAPKIIGGRAAPTPVGGQGIKDISQALPVRIKSVKMMGQDILIEGEPKRNE